MTETPTVALSGAELFLEAVDNALMFGEGPLNGEDAIWLATDIVDCVVSRLRRDPAMPARTREQRDLALADVRGDVERLLARALEEFDLGDFLETIADGLAAPPS